MKMTTQILNLLPADRIVVPKSELRLVEHHALYLGRDQFGQDLFAENNIAFGVRLAKASEIFKDVIEVKRIERFNGTNAERRLAVQKALKKLGQPYHLINYNCQHFASDVQYNKPESKQVNNVLVALLAFIFIDLFFTD